MASLRPFGRASHLRGDSRKDYESPGPTSRKKVLEHDLNGLKVGAKTQAGFSYKQLEEVVMRSLYALAHLNVCVRVLVDEAEVLLVCGSDPGGGTAPAEAAQNCACRAGFVVQDNCN
ncbi:hypothetical protein IRJ41_015527 [Triplophysa rosa]|uniref:Uncharacterized protein n=1 Tax=Triplophysa rosa TaxID=992332 RepID=A0A9W7WK68_TRIRA|nr:hypothetical protein IRJ41_015527 [Triplophysa rosa]